MFLDRSSDEPLKSVFNTLLNTMKVSFVHFLRGIKLEFGPEIDRNLDEALREYHLGA